MHGDTQKRPRPTSGLRHVALFVENFEQTVRFYTQLLGMVTEWQPDQDNVYLTSGSDNLALHRVVTTPHSLATCGTDQQNSARIRLDHIGFIIDDLTEVDVWYDFLKSNEVRITKAPKTHRDGARSFYCLDPDGNVVQMMYHPTISTPNHYT